MSNIFKINKTELTRLIQESIENNLSATKLYHVVTRRHLKEGQNVIDLCRMVYRDGLIPFNNGEVGECIWFWVGEPFYKGSDMFILSLDYTHENKDLFEIYVDKPNAWAHRQIPLTYLNVESAPWALYANGATPFYNKLSESNKNFYKNFLERHAKTNFNTMSKDILPITVYVDVLPKELLELIPKNDERFKFDLLFK